MRTLLKRLKLAGMLGLLIGLSGCATRVIVVDRENDAVKIGKKMRGYIYTMDENKVWVLRGKATLPEGWYAGPGPKE